MGAVHHNQIGQNMLKDSSSGCSGSGDGIDLYAEDYEPEGLTDALEVDDGINIFEDFNNANTTREADSKRMINSPAAVRMTSPSCPVGQKPEVESNSKKCKGPENVVLVGGLPWWTTDKNMYDSLLEIGVTDCLEVKFYENRINGQSKGYCILKVGSKLSVQAIHEKLSSIEIRGCFPAVAHPTHAAVKEFESQSKTRLPRGKTNGEAQENVDIMEPKTPMDPGPRPMMFGPRTSMPMWRACGPRNMCPPFRHPPPAYNCSQRPPMSYPNFGYPPRPPMHFDKPPMRMTMPCRGPFTDSHMMDDREQQQLSRNDWNGGPPLMAQQMRPICPAQQMRPICPAPPRMNPEFSEYVWCQPHVRPPPASSGGIASGFSPKSCNPTLGDHQIKGTMMSAFEFDKAMNQNRTVSGAAIFRAIEDASNGDFESAVETVLTAIAIIQHSRVGNSEPCSILISSLQATLNGIESQSYRRNRNRSKSRSRSLSRERERRTSQNSRIEVQSRSREREYERDLREKNRDRNDENRRARSRTRERESRDRTRTTRDRSATRSIERRYYDTSYHRHRAERDLRDRRKTPE